MQAKPKNNASDLSLEGLEGLLDPSDSQEEGTAHGATEELQDWTVEESSRALGLTRGAIIRRLEDGILPGYKVKRPYGWVWRVKPVWLGQKRNETRAEQEDAQDEFTPDDAQQRAEAHEEKKTEARHDHAQQQDLLEVFDADDVEFMPPATTSGVRELIQLKTKLEMTQYQFQDTVSKLETANYRIGYLEARLEASQEQLKMLTDSRRMEPWWQRWSQWFTSSSI